MADQNFQWGQIKDFLKKAGDDMKKVGEDIKAETTRLVEDLRDPNKQAKAKEKLSELGTWAKTTAQGAADMAEVALKRIEEGMSSATDYVSDTLGGSGKQGGVGSSDAGEDDKTPADPAPAMKSKSTKTAKKKPATKKKVSASTKTGTKKPAAKKKSKKT